MEVPHSGIGAHSPEAPRDAGIRVCLDHVLASPEFTASRRRSQLLRYVVEQTLAGRAEHISEYGIGLDVFRKPESFDPRMEGIVRVEMSRLRRALADYYQKTGSADPWRIEFPTRGYIPAIVGYPALQAGTLAAQVAVVGEDGGAPAQPNSRLRWWPIWSAAIIATIALGALALRNASPWPAPIRSVVVLPLENLTGDSRNEYLSDGITEQLTDSLAHIPSFRVVARTSAFQFKGKGVDIRDVGRQLNVDAVVEGSLRKVNDRFRLTVQVNRTVDGYHILSQTFDGGMADLFRLENEMTLPVVAALRPGTSFANRQEPDPEAHNLYLQARSYRGQATLESFQQAISYLDRAIERDPKYAAAYAALAGVYASGAANLATEPLQFVPQTRAAAARAIELVV
jgi:TolB-like protein